MSMPVLGWLSVLSSRMVSPRMWPKSSELDSRRESLNERKKVSEAVTWRGGVRACELHVGQW